MGANYVELDGTMMFLPMAFPDIRETCHKEF